VLREGPGRYTRPGLPTGCLVASGDSGTTNFEVCQQLTKIRARKAAAFARKIRADVKAGRLPADTDATALGRYTMAMVTGIAQSARDGVPRAQLRRVADLAMRAWP
jgi:hypothetical protein